MTVRPDRRKNRDGTYREFWMADVCVEPPQGGPPIRDRKPFKSKRLAEQWEQRRRAELLTGRGVVESKPEPAKPLAPTFREFAEEWLRVYVATNSRDSTGEWRAIQIGRLNTVLGDVRLDELTTEAVERFKAKYKADGYSNSTINGDLSAFGTCLRVARDWGRPVAKVEARKLPKVQLDEDHLSEEEIAALVRMGDSLTVVGLETGLRVSELRALRWVDVDLRAAQITVRRSFDDKERETAPKGGRKRTVPLSALALSTLRAEQHLQGDWVWMREGRHLKRTEATNAIERCCRIARVRLVTPHVLRHTFASRLVQKGAALRAVQELLGHSSITQTMRYAHLAPNTTRDAIGLLNGNLTATHLAAVANRR